MKKYIFASLFCLLLIFLVVRAGHSQIKAYYSGDAINFQDQLYVGSTNSDSLEIFKLSDNELKPLFKIKPVNDNFGGSGAFYDVKFAVENGHLFAYTISGYTLYKYEVLSDTQLVLNNSSKNNYWEWYSRLDRFGSDLVTISGNGVKIWNKDLQVVNAYAVIDKDSPYNLRSYNSDSILDVQNNHLTVYSRTSRAVTLSVPVNYKSNPGNRQSYQDEQGNLFVVDDYYFKKFDVAGNILGNFKHAPFQGYDVSASGANDYIYFTNGAGLVKLDKNTFKEVGYRWTTSLGGPGSWAMGLKVVDVNGDKVVIFNGSNILVLDQNLRKLADLAATEKSDEASSENLYLNLDHNFAEAGNTITLSGGGYFPNEQLSVNFGGVTTNIQANNHGRFAHAVVVPDLKPSAVDIKVIGADSRLSYSISFTIIK
jgi:hypothetical protein